MAKRGAIARVRGMPDWLPTQVNHWRKTLAKLVEVCQQYGYFEIITPAIESVQLFERSVGMATDILEKELYRIPMADGDTLALRPEATASIVRSVLEHQLARGRSPKLFYQGPMWRHDRPQKGRYRQFHQLGLEQFGDPLAEIELLLICQRWWQLLGITDKVELQLHTLGDLNDRVVFLKELQIYFNQHLADLDEDSRRRLHSNPLRILDSKQPSMQSLIQSAPKMIDYLGKSASQHWQTVCQILDQLGISYRINPSLVRGLDYYNRTVFEWYATEQGGQSTILAGGRYDSLLEQFGQPELPACGMALGIERLLGLLDQEPELPRPICLCICLDSYLCSSYALWESLRDHIAGLSGWVLPATTIKKSLQLAAKYHPRFVLFSDQASSEQGHYILKEMDSGKQQSLAYEAIISYLSQRISEQ